MLRDNGYQIGKSYKVWSPGSPVDAPIGGQKYAYEKSGIMPQHFSNHAMPMVKAGVSVTEAREKILAQVRGNFDDFLADRQPGKPWLYFFGPTTTHRFWVKGSGKILWGIDPDSLKGKLPEFLPDVPEIREDVADYLGECEAVDAYTGVLMKRLEEIGELDKTIIIISGDHGMPGSAVRQSRNLYDHGVSVALIIKVPGNLQGGWIVDDVVRLPDLAPTFMEIGGVKPPDNLYGKSLMPLLKSEKNGQIDEERTWAITGRERHVDKARRRKPFLSDAGIAHQRFSLHPQLCPRSLADGSASRRGHENLQSRRRTNWSTDTLPLPSPGHGRQPHESLAGPASPRGERKVVLRPGFWKATIRGALRLEQRP